MMAMSAFVSQDRLPEFGLWKKITDRRVPIDFHLEISARCNNDCRHCYINLPAGDQEARRKELSPAEISDIADQAVELGALWCLITGGEPLVRQDFAEIYLSLKKKGLLVSLFTNACLVSEEHIKLLRRYPPRDIEVSVYGVTQQTYEQVTRRPGSFAAFQRGLGMMLNAGLKIRLKAMALRSNVHELPEIAKFCRQYTRDKFRFDPMLNLRHDQNPLRNEEIRQERLSPAQIAAIEQADEERAEGLEKGCDQIIFPEYDGHVCDHLFHCGAGNKSFNVSYDGVFRLCSSLWHPACTYDLRQGTLAEAWNSLVPRVRELRSVSPIFLERCRKCPIINLCLWCPANAALETGEMDGYAQYFCDVAHARAAAIQARRKAKE
jgi:radical SAM protein with 4Fe4S-binding SPASM domain